MTDHHDIFRIREFCLRTAIVLICLCPCVQGQVAKPVTDNAGPKAAPLERHAGTVEPTLDEFKQWRAERSEQIASLNLAIKSKQDKEAIEAAKPLVDTDRKLMTFVENAADATIVQKNAFRRQFLDTAGWLAAKSEETDQCEAAVALRNEIVAALVKQHGPNHWMVIDAKLAVAHAETLLGWTAAERDSWRQLSDDRRRALQLRLSRKYAEAILAYQEALKSYEALKGADDSDYAEILNNLALLYYETGDYARADPIFVRASEIRKRTLGENHPDLATCVCNQALLYSKMGRKSQAEPLFLRACDILKRTLGENDPELAVVLSNLAVLYYESGDYARAEPLYIQARDIRKQTRGADHPEYARSLICLAVLYAKKSDNARAEPLFIEACDIFKKSLGENHPDYATSVNNLGALYEALGDYVRAERHYVQACDIYRRSFGENHPSYAMSLSNLAELFIRRGDYARAEPLLIRSRDIRKLTLGVDHADYAISLTNLAQLYYESADYGRSEPLFVQARDIYRKTLGENHADYAASLNNLAGLYDALGDFSRAEPLYLQARDIRKRALGENHPDYAVSLNNLAYVYCKTADPARAEPLYIEARNILRKSFGENHPAYALSLNNLAMLYFDMGSYSRAEPLLDRVREIRQKSLGETHPLYAKSLGNLAGVHIASRDYGQAAPLLLQASDILRKTIGENHPDYAISLNNLADLYMKRGEFAQAEPLFIRACSIQQHAVGEKRLDYANTLNNLAATYRSMNDPLRAEERFRQALEITRHSLESIALIQSERTQLAMGRNLRYQLDAYVSLGINSPQMAERIFRETLLWKGATLVRQRGMRLVADDPGVTESFGKLQETARHLVALSRKLPEKEDLRAEWRKRIAALTQEKETLEAELSKRSAAYRAATKEVTLEDLLQALPKDTVLVDYLEFTHSTPSRGKDKPARFERQLVAFVVRPTAKAEDRVKMFPLGPAAPIGQAIDVWRESFGTSAASVSAGRRLRESLWETLLPALAEAKTILVSTDGVLGRLPLVALPGKAPDSYLLEDHRLALIPVPQLLPALVNHAGKRELEKELLLIGDVDYDSSGTTDPKTPPKKKSPRRPGEPNRAPGRDALFDELEYTKGEIDGLRELYIELFDVAADDPFLLNRGAATEAEFRNLAPRYRHLHLATHGFFAGPEYAAARNETSKDGERGSAMLIGRDAPLIGYNPGLLSGLALAGANLEPRDDADDGILTSQEIAFLPLQGVDLIVLSACETGLGDVAGGEGLLGVQRAFQTAGVGTTIAGLWKVDDLQTMALMKRFYRNLWKEEMSRLDALREAQLWMLKEGPRRDTRINVPAGQESPEPKRSPPYYWAPFVLSGDWR